MNNTKLYPRIGIGILIICQNEILLLKRHGSHGEGTWCLGGGHLQFGETISDGAKREVWEEVGIKLNKLELICINEELDFIQTDKKHYVTIGCLSIVQSKAFTNKEPAKHSEINWFDFNQLPSPLFIPSQNIIKCYLNNKLTLI